jgi:hypothetical protein
MYKKGPHFNLEFSQVQRQKIDHEDDDLLNYDCTSEEKDSQFFEWRSTFNPSPRQEIK